MVEPLLLSGVGRGLSSLSSASKACSAHALPTQWRGLYRVPMRSTAEATEQQVERPSVSSDLGPNREEILAGRPFYLRAGMSVSTGILPPFETNGHTLNCPVCLLV